jgi:hypothetical protein
MSLVVPVKLNSAREPPIVKATAIKAYMTPITSPLVSCCANWIKRSNPEIPHFLISWVNQMTLNHHSSKP